MKICLPISAQNNETCHRLSNHFGRAHGHIIVDGSSGTILTESTAEACRGQHCAPIDWMAAQGVNLVLCRSLGRGAVARLKQAGIEVLQAPSGSIKDALNAWRNGHCKPIESAALCNGHHDHHHT